MKDTYCVLGYCRSTFGGFDVWKVGADGEEYAVGMRRMVSDSTINKMNYEGLLFCLESIRDEAVGRGEAAANAAPVQISVWCGCFLVCKHLSGGYQSAVLRPYFALVRQLLDELTALRVTVTCEYVPDLCVPKQFMLG